jgi:NAD(P)-dependent dehydrogenase (short-subunit alcohol dehydrogenase family)
MTLALNHLGYFLLTNLILDILKASAPARIVNVSSDAHEFWPFNFDDPEGKAKYRGMRAYGQSKLANLYFTFELAKRLEGTGVTVTALHPGFVQTNFFAGNGRMGAFFRWANRNFGTPAEIAARPAIYLATSPEVEGVTGRYYDWPRGRKTIRPLPGSKAARDADAARRLWEWSEAKTGLAATAPAS